MTQEEKSSHHLKEAGSVFGKKLYHCGHCGILFNEKGLSGFNAKELYSDYYDEKIKGRFNFGLERIVQGFRFLRAAGIKKACPRGTGILDIGSGRGYTLYFLKRFFDFKRTEGIQISKRIADFSRARLGLKIHEEDFLDIPFQDEDFDAVTMWHVLEHLDKPEEYIAKSWRLLKPHGKLMIEVPNLDAWSRRLCGEYWLSWDINYHLLFFDPGALISLLRRHRFKINSLKTFSLEYSVFTSAQSIVSRITKTRHLFFNFLQNPSFTPLLPLHLVLFLLALPLCLIVNLLLIGSGRGEVISIIAEKRNPGEL